MEDYLIVVGDTPKELDNKVFEWLQKGWVPQGGVAVLPATADTIPQLLQAIVLK